MTTRKRSGSTLEDGVAKFVPLPYSVDATRSSGEWRTPHRAGSGTFFMRISSAAARKCSTVREVPPWIGFSYLRRGKWAIDPLFLAPENRGTYPTWRSPPESAFLFVRRWLPVTRTNGPSRFDPATVQTQPISGSDQPAVDLQVSTLVVSIRIGRRS